MLIHTHKVGVNRSYLALQHESVAEAGHQSSALCFTSLLWYSNILQGLTIPVPCAPGHTRHRPGLTTSVSIYSITGSCTMTVMRRKEPGSQSRCSPNKPVTSRPLPILVLLIFLLPASPADTVLGSVPQPLGLPCGSPGSPAARGTRGALQSSIKTWKQRGHGCLLTSNPMLSQLARHVFALFIENS